MLFDPISDYLIHGISGGRAFMRVLAAVALAGGYLLLDGSPPLQYLALPLFALASLYVLYDLATIARHTR